PVLLPRVLLGLAPGNDGLPDGRAVGPQPPVPVWRRLASAREVRSWDPFRSCSDWKMSSAVGGWRARQAGRSHWPVTVPDVLRTEGYGGPWGGGKDLPSPKGEEIECPVPASWSRRAGTAHRLNCSGRCPPDEGSLTRSALRFDRRPPRSPGRSPCPARGRSC